MKAGLFGFAAIILAVPAAAQEDPLAPLSESDAAQPSTPEPQQRPTPVVATPPTGQAPSPNIVRAAPAPVVQVPRSWREVFGAIRSGNWSAARAGIAVLPRGPLTAFAQAELYTAKGSPVVGLGEIQALLAEAPELPQAEQLARMAMTRGAAAPPAIVAKNPLVFLGGAPGRNRARPVAGEPAADDLRSKLDPLNETNQAQAAELLLMQVGPSLSYEARAEAGQRVAWIYYRNGHDADARRVAETWRVGAAGDWAVHAAWVSGLASWRLNDCEAASRSFREVARLSRERELTAAGHFWTARAEQACRRPQSVTPLLKAAAQSPESFYGLLARESLGADKTLPSYAVRATEPVDQLPNVRRAIELAQIGQHRLADELLRHQARLSRSSQHAGLVAVAKRLDLASAQYWLARNGPQGTSAQPKDRYPAPRWTPMMGWRIDPALAFAHIMQESTFRTEAVSPVGAVGLMQVRPGSAGDMARSRNLPFSPAMLTDPTANLEYGQSYIEMLRSLSSTQGQLPKVIAAYNAGPLPVSRWSINDRGDPLLWIESIPYWETRYYVPAVLRNMWVYQTMAGAGTPTLSSIAQHKWPAFPLGKTNLAALSINAEGEP